MTSEEKILKFYKDHEDLIQEIIDGESAWRAHNEHEKDCIECSVMFGMVSEMSVELHNAKEGVDNLLADLGDYLSDHGDFRVQRVYKFLDGLRTR